MKLLKRFLYALGLTVSPCGRGRSQGYSTTCALTHRLGGAQHKPPRRLGLVWGAGSLLGRSHRALTDAFAAAGNSDHPRRALVRAPACDWEWRSRTSRRHPSPLQAERKPLSSVHQQSSISCVLLTGWIAHVSGAKVLPHPQNASAYSHAAQDASAAASAMAADRGRNGCRWLSGRERRYSRRY